MLHTDHHSVLELIGSTPSVELPRFGSGGPRIFGKLEGLNPGGSSKDRAAVSMVGRALDAGLIRPGGTIVESSSGNLGVALALVARSMGLSFTCVADPHMPRASRALIEALGGTVHAVDQPDENGNHLRARIRTAEALGNEPNTFWTNQYHNDDNPAAYSGLVDEIVRDIPTGVDWIVLPVGTGGLATGVARSLRERGSTTRVRAVDAVGSVSFGQVARRRHQIGIGAAIRPRHVEPDLYDEVVFVDDATAFWHVRHLASRHQVFAGGSSGAAYAAALDLAASLPSDAAIMVVMPDRGDRYLDTIFCDDWLRSKGLDAALGRACRHIIPGPSNLVIEA